MNKNLLTASALVLLLIVIGGGLVFYKTKVAPQTTTSQASAMATATPMSTPDNKQSLKSLMALTGTQQCMFQDAETSSTGVVYINNGKFRGDFTSKVNNTSTISHMISNGTDVYVWMDGQKDGFKISSASIDKMTSTVQKGAVDVHTKVDYQCTPWATVDATKFTVPTTVKFADMSSMMQNLPPMQSTGSGNMMSTKAQQCATCNQLPQAQQAQCKTALQCN